MESSPLVLVLIQWLKPGHGRALEVLEEFACKRQPAVDVGALRGKWKPVHLGMWKTRQFHPLCRWSPLFLKSLLEDEVIFLPVQKGIIPASAGPVLRHCSVLQRLVKPLGSFRGKT